MKKLCSLLFFVLFLFSCRSGDQEQVININNKYSLTIPDFLTKVNNLNDDASLQYQHGRKEFYVIVLDELKQEMHKALADNNLTGLYPENLAGYSNLLMSNLEQGITISDRTEMKDTMINDMPARVTTIKGQVQGIDIYYALAFAEGKNSYYQVMTWTLASKEKEHREKMQKLLYTLKEM